MNSIQSDGTQGGQAFPDGWYKISDGEEAWVGYVHHGALGDDAVEWMLEEGYELNPVVVLTPAEHDALDATIATQATRLEAQAGLMALVEMDNARLVKWNAELERKLRLLLAQINRWTYYDHAINTAIEEAREILDDGKDDDDERDY